MLLYYFARKAARDSERVRKRERKMKRGKKKEKMGMRTGLPAGEFQRRPSGVQSCGVLPVLRGGLGSSGGEISMTSSQEPSLYFFTPPRSHCFRPISAFVSQSWLNCTGSKSLRLSCQRLSAPAWPHSGVSLWSIGWPQDPRRASGHALFCCPLFKGAGGGQGVTEAAGKNPSSGRQRLSLGQRDPSNNPF